MEFLRNLFKRKPAIESLRPGQQIGDSALCVPQNYKQGSALYEKDLVPCCISGNDEPFINSMEEDPRSGMFGVIIRTK